VTSATWWSRTFPPHSLVRCVMIPSGLSCISLV
jgi:hypothetical protein